MTISDFTAYLFVGFKLDRSGDDLKNSNVEGAIFPEQTFTEPSSMRWIYLPSGTGRTNSRTESRRGFPEHLTSQRHGNCPALGHSPSI
jgi:hypothetical protein